MVEESREMWEEVTVTYFNVRIFNLSRRNYEKSRWY